MPGCLSYIYVMQIILQTQSTFLIGINIPPNCETWRIVKGFRTFATGMTCRQGMLTPPDTWSCPFWGLYLFNLSRPETPNTDWTLWQFVTLLRYLTFFTESDILPNIGFHRASATVVAFQQGALTSPLHLVPSHSGLSYVLLVETNSFPELVVIFCGLCYSNIPRYFLDFAICTLGGIHMVH